MASLLLSVLCILTVESQLKDCHQSPNLTLPNPLSGYRMANHKRTHSIYLFGGWTKFAILHSTVRMKLCQFHFDSLSLYTWSFVWKIMQNSKHGLPLQSHSHIMVVSIIISDRYLQMDENFCMFSAEHCITQNVIETATCNDCNIANLDTICHVVYINGI